MLFMNLRQRQPLEAGLFYKQECNCYPEDIYFRKGLHIKNEKTRSDSGFLVRRYFLLSASLFSVQAHRQVRDCL